jgi:predicted MPP superfamily phosphohydrolase
MSAALRKPPQHGNPGRLTSHRYRIKRLPLRIIHTSDWHLGQTLHQFDRSVEHQAFLDWLSDTLVSEQTDALLICGDIFDTANPSAAAQKQFYRFLQQSKTACRNYRSSSLRATMIRRGVLKHRPFTR